MGSPTVLDLSGKRRKHKRALSEGNKVPFLSNVANSRTGQQSLHTKPDAV